MDFNKSTKTKWILFCLLLFTPFLIESFVIAPITLTSEPLYIWGAVHWIFCYVAYGYACFFYIKWQKRIDNRIIIKFQKNEIKWFLLALLMGVVGKRIFDIISVFIFSSTVLHINTPMIYRDIVGYIQIEPIWLGVGTFVMQYIYYIFEFTLIALIVDCAQKTSMRIGLSQKIPWGGIFLVLTWGLIHRYGIITPILRGEYEYSLRMILNCMLIGFAYMLPNKKPAYAFFAIMSWYWL